MHHATTLVTVPLSALGSPSWTLAPQRMVALHRTLTDTNICDFEPGLGEHLLNDVYIDRDAHLDAIELIALPPLTRVLKGGDFAVLCGDRLIKEHFPVYWRGVPELLEAIAAEDACIDVEQETILLARFGIFTWGHWLGELLPKAVLAEARFPGRFMYMVPTEVLEDDSPEQPWVRILQSLQAYGIGCERLLPVDSERTYRFARAFSVSPVWSDRAVHPFAATAMREGLQIPLQVTPEIKLAVRRVEDYGRTLDNWEQIEAVLVKKGFTIETTGNLTFKDQVDLFARASVVIGILGSDLTNLMYAPAGVQVITLAPSNFGDYFFFALIQERKGTQTDLRGPVTTENQETAHRSAFHVDVVEFEKYLGKLA